MLSAVLARLAFGATLAFALLTGSARAQDATVVLAPVAAPLRTGVTHATASTLSLDVTNQRTDARLCLVEFTLPGGYAGTSTAPSGWSVDVNGSVIRFRALWTCATDGIESGGSSRFVLNVTPPSASAPSDVTEQLGVRAGTCTVVWFIIPVCTSDWSVDGVAFVRRVLRVGTPTATSSLNSAVVSWPVTNRSSAPKTISLEPGALAGLPAPVCPPVTVNAGATGTIACTYANPASGTYTFAASASAGAAATAVGNTGAATIGVIHLAWRGQPRIVVGRTATPYEFTLDLFDDSPSRIQRVDVNLPAGWSGAKATGGESGLQPSTNCSASSTACWVGPMNSGATRAALTFRVTSALVPASASREFVIRLTPRGGGAAVDVFLSIMVHVPIPDVEGLTVLSNEEGQFISWTNSGRADALHDGVVVFRTEWPAVPPRPVDFVDYAAQPVPELIHVDLPGATTRDLTDGIGRYNYRVCNRDAHLVYSDCRTGFWNRGGYVDSAQPPSGGWTHQLGGEALQLPSVTSGNRVSIVTNRPAIDLLDLRDGMRLHDPIPLPSLPSSSTPSTVLANGKLALFAADQSGAVTAVDLEAGEILWQAANDGESFVAGVAGITRSFGAPAFQAAYPHDLLLLGSATTGNVLAIDGVTGETLWTVNAGAPVSSLVNYDARSNRFYVTTEGNGVVAFDLTGSGPSAATPALPVAGWVNPDPGGLYTLHCTRSYQAGRLGCVNRAGMLREIDGATGAVLALHDTGLRAPSSIVRAPAPAYGYVVGNATEIQRLAADATSGLSRAGSWLASAAGTEPATTISSALILSTSGYIMVSSADGALHRLRLSDASHLSQSPPVSSATGGPLELGPVAYDTANGMFVFGTAEGRVWAVPSSSF